MTHLRLFSIGWALLQLFCVFNNAKKLKTLEILKTEFLSLNGKEFSDFKVTGPAGTGKGVPSPFL